MGEGLKRAFAATRATQKPTKYRAVRTTVDGITFASKAEANRHSELLLLQRAGKIRNLKRQPRYTLVVGTVKIASYVGDWFYEEEVGPTWNIGVREPVWQPTVEDKKGFETPVFKLKWKLCQALYPDIEWKLS